jgi:hypothetical protein
MLTREAKYRMFLVYKRPIFILYKILIKLPSKVFSAIQTVLLLISGICGCFVCLCVCVCVSMCLSVLIQAQFRRNPFAWQAWDVSP